MVLIYQIEVPYNKEKWKMLDDAPIPARWNMVKTKKKIIYCFVDAKKAAF